jgi:hypothetical protein
VRRHRDRVCNFAQRWSTGGLVRAQDIATKNPGCVVGTLVRQYASWVWIGRVRDIVSLVRLWQLGRVPRLNQGLRVLFELTMNGPEPPLLLGAATAGLDREYVGF